MIIHTSVTHRILYFPCKIAYVPTETKFFFKFKCKYFGSIQLKKNEIKKNIELIFFKL